MNGNGNGKAGRPRGSGYDDSAGLAGVAAYVEAHPGVSIRAAISASLDRTSPNFDADLRRLQRKIAAKDSPRTVDLLAQPFGHGPPRKTAMWSCHVDVPVDGVHGVHGVTLSVVVGRPVLVVVRDDRPLGRPEQPDHPLFRAVETLPVRHGFDHPDYRLICEAIGLDPDRGRPPYIEAYEDAVDMLGSAIGRGLSAIGRETAVMGAALGLFDGTTFRPGALRRVIELESDPERAVRILDQAVAVMRGTDWTRMRTRAALRMAATPWGFEHESHLDVGATPKGGLPGHSIMDMPLFLEPPHPHDLAGRMLALLYERDLLAVVLSPEEWERWKAGGDHAHWLRMKDYTVPASEKGRRAACDLSMTTALREAMLSTAYEGYLARIEGRPFDPQGPFAYERHGRSIPASGPLTPRPLPSAVRAASWHLATIAGGMKDRFGCKGKRVARQVRVWGGDVSLTVYENGEASMRTGRLLPHIDGRPVEVSVTFGHRSRAFGLVPMIHHADFRMTYADGGEPLPKDLALPLLALLEAVAFGLPVPKYGEVMWLGPMSHPLRMSDGTDADVLEDGHAA